MIENAQVIDRQWPAPKTLTRDARIDELTRDAMYRRYDWLKTLTDDDLRDLAGTVLGACWRGNYRDAEERLFAIKDALEGLIEGWAENEAEDEE